MGLDSNCRVTLNGQTAEGVAHCGDGEITFRGPFALRWKWSELGKVSAQDGLLRLNRGADVAEFELGDRAEKWLQTIKNPKPRLDKLDLKPGHSYQSWGEFDDAFAGELLGRAGDPGADPLDCVFVRLNSQEDLPMLLDGREKIAPNGMVWAVWPKGRKELREDDIRNFALANGLVDVKVASFSGTLSALKLVIPLALRPTGARKR